MTTYYAVRHVGGELATLASESGQQVCMFTTRDDAEACMSCWHADLFLRPEEFPLVIEEVQL